MKEFWLEPNPTLGPALLQRLLSDVRPDVIILPQRVEGITARIATRNLNGDIFLTRDHDEVELARKQGKPVGLELVIRDRTDQKHVLETLESRPDYVIIECPDWKIIPLENLISQSKKETKLIARASSFKEAKLALTTLELGADGIVLASDTVEDVLKTWELVTAQPEKILLKEATVTVIRNLGMGVRACVDTCEMIGTGEGLLTGSSSQALFLVEGEVYSNPHVNPRPFRVNAGPVSLYALTPNGKTRYLSELSAGDTVLLVNRKGQTRSVDVARVKIERRPLVLVEGLVENRAIKTIVQNAETVRLVTPDGSKPVTELKEGDKVLVRVEEGGRHFGTIVSEEMIIEK